MIDLAHPDYTNTPASDRRPGYDYRPVDPTAPPVVTIVTPYYNTGAIFHETARSVLRQSFQQWEWIIVNDGSTDPEALAVLDSYRNTDARIRVIDHEVNQGPSAGRNTAYRAARASTCSPARYGQYAGANSYRKMDLAIGVLPGICVCEGLLGWL